MAGPFLQSRIDEDKSLGISHIQIYLLVVASSELELISEDVDIPQFSEIDEILSILRVRHQSIRLTHLNRTIEREDSKETERTIAANVLMSVCQIWSN
jgi:hypothetical protein